MSAPGTHASLYLAIDQGGHASRALLLDHAGRVVSHGSRPVQSREPHPGWVEQDPEEVLHSVDSSIQQALAGFKTEEVVAAGLATQRSSIVCWRGGSGEPLSPVISWQDRRTGDWVASLASHEAQIHACTGLRLSPHYGASKLRWCLENLPAVRQASARGDLCFGPLASFLVYRLTAEHSFLVDPANAARTLLYSLEARDWDSGLLELFDIPRASLPRCVPTRYGFGSLRTGGRPIALRIVTGDQSAALFGYGAPRPAIAYVNIGTGGFIQRLCGPQPQRHPRLLSSIVFESHGFCSYVLEGTVNGAGSALRWAEQELGLSGLGERLAAWLESERGPVLFLNGIGGLGAPFWIADFSSRFVGCGGPQQKAVGVAESIIFLVHENLQAMRACSAPLERVVLSGGLAVFDGLCQRLADISRLPVFRPSESEATARGVAFLLQDPSLSWPEPAGGWFWPLENAPLVKRYRLWRAALDRALEPRRPLPW
ncbi:MAG: FGGY family carbohydrate kinase [Gammaproteobacteria bacterium]|nr:FGGY family carbohydrate kinase [Gammaproteobacteria bacterium]